MKHKLIKLSGLAFSALFLSMNSFSADPNVGEKTYQQACAMCHASGVAGAPIIGKKSDWTERLKKGQEALVTSAIKGLGAMPAKGGQSQLTDEAVTASVDFMVAALNNNETAKKITPVVETKPVVLNANEEKGKAIAYDRATGNCVTCHVILDADFPGNSGPPLNNMHLRYPDKNVLRAQIADATQRNPETFMPPYGRHQILTKEELDLVTEFIHTL